MIRGRAAGLVVLLIAAALSWALRGGGHPVGGGPAAPPPPAAPGAPAGTWPTLRGTPSPARPGPGGGAASGPAAEGTRGLLAEVRVEDFGREVYRGPIDLRPTLERIRAGRRLRFRDDGIEFGNRERRLPARPAGYYHEYVHPTDGLDGPGPQRVVTGEGGEVFYTPDHYRSFVRVE